MATETIYPVGDGTNKQWTPSSGTDHYELVNEAGTPNDTDKLTVAADGKKDDLVLGPVTTLHTITGFKIKLRIKGTASPADPALAADLIMNGAVVESFTGGVDTSGAFVNFEFTSSTMNIIAADFNAGTPTLRIRSINNSLGGGGSKYPDWFEDDA